MSVRRSLASYKFRCFLELLSRCRSGHIPEPKLGHDYSMHRGLPLISADYGTCSKPHSTMLKDNSGRIQAPLPAPRRPRFSVWARWILGTVASLFLPFWKTKRKKLQQLEGEVEVVVEEVENVAEVVEKTATVAENVCAEVAGKLPDNGRLKEAVLFVERVSEETARDAQLTKDFIHKVDALKQDLQELEKTVEPPFHKTIEK